MRVFGSLNLITFSPVVTIEPRRRKFHCPIRLKIPLPPSYEHKSGKDDLRLLCSISGGSNRAVWEDVTGNTPTSIVDKCLVFTTTISARFWLGHCQRWDQVGGLAEMCRYADDIWRQLIRVPFMAKFVIFAKRSDANEANLRIFCMTDDKEDERALEQQEHYDQVAKSRDLEVVEGQKLWLEFGGNLSPYRLGAGSSGVGGSSRQLNSAIVQRNHWAASTQPIFEQLNFVFKPFEENRLAFVVRLKDVGREPTGRIGFMRESIRWLSSLPANQQALFLDDPNRPVCTLGLKLPPICVQYDDILGTPRRNSYLANSRLGKMSLAEIAAAIDAGCPQQQWQSQQQQSSDQDRDSLQGSTFDGPNAKPDWARLAPRLGVPRDEMDLIASQWPRMGGLQSDSPTLGLLLHWHRLVSNQEPEIIEQDLARALLSVGRRDVAEALGIILEQPRGGRSRSSLRELNNTNGNGYQQPSNDRSQENLYANAAMLNKEAARAKRAEEAEAEVEAERRQRRRFSSRSRSRSSQDDAKSTLNHENDVDMATSNTKVRFSDQVSCMLEQDSAPDLDQRSTTDGLHAANDLTNDKDDAQVSATEHDSTSEPSFDTHSDASDVNVNNQKHECCEKIAACSQSILEVQPLDTDSAVILLDDVAITALATALEVEAEAEAFVARMQTEGATNQNKVDTCQQNDAYPQLHNSAGDDDQLSSINTVVDLYEQPEHQSSLPQSQFDDCNQHHDFALLEGDHISAGFKQVDCSDKDVEGDLATCDQHFTVEEFVLKRKASIDLPSTHREPSRRLSHGSFRRTSLSLTSEPNQMRPATRQQVNHHFGSETRKTFNSIPVDLNETTSSCPTTKRASFSMFLGHHRSVSSSSPSKSYATAKQHISTSNSTTYYTNARTGGELSESGHGHHQSNNTISNSNSFYASARSDTLIDQPDLLHGDDEQAEVDAASHSSRTISPDNRCLSGDELEDQFHDLPVNNDEQLTETKQEHAATTKELGAFNDDYPMLHLQGDLELSKSQENDKQMDSSELLREFAITEASCIIIDCVVDLESSSKEVQANESTNYNDDSYQLAELHAKEKHDNWIIESVEEHVSELNVCDSANVVKISTDGDRYDDPSDSFIQDSNGSQNKIASNGTAASTTLGSCSLVVGSTGQSECLIDLTCDENEDQVADQIDFKLDVEQLTESSIKEAIRTLDRMQNQDNTGDNKQAVAIASRPRDLLVSHQQEMVSPSDVIECQSSSSGSNSIKKDDSPSEEQELVTSSKSSKDQVRSTPSPSASSLCGSSTGSTRSSSTTRSAGGTTTRKHSSSPRDNPHKASELTRHMLVVQLEQKDRKLERAGTRVNKRSQSEHLVRAPATIAANGSKSNIPVSGNLRQVSSRSTDGKWSGGSGQGASGGHQHGSDSRMCYCHRLG